MNSTKETDQIREDNWIKPLIVGAILGAVLPFVFNIIYQAYQDEKLVISMANDLLYEINRNQENVSTASTTLASIGDFRRPNKATIIANEEFLFSDFYDLYFSQKKLSLFDNQTRYSIITYYGNMRVLKVRIKALEEMLKAYYSDPPGASMENINDRIASVRDTSATLISQGDDVKDMIKDTVLSK